MFMPLSRPQLKISAFSGKFNVCSKCLFLSWIKICRDFTLQTQDFYSEIKELTQILLRISEEKFGGWSLWSGQVSNEVLSLYHHGELGNSSTGSKWEGFDELGIELLKNKKLINPFFQSVHQRTCDHQSTCDDLSTATTTCVRFATFANLQNQGASQKHASQSFFKTKM